MSDGYKTSAFNQQLDTSAQRINGVLDGLLPLTGGPEAQLMAAVRYSTLASGKRVRPFLALHCAALFDVDVKQAERVAAAIEMVHCYSLIHDDLPAMDDDDLRRGQPTCHVRFDEATAILAGDALVARAFEVLAEDETHQDPSVRIELVRQLAAAAGPLGMVGGQMLDLVAGRHNLDVSEVARLQRMKTGALFDFSCLSGAVLGKASEHAHHMLHGYAHDLGLAFQIIDDLLDAEGDPERLGKRAGKDAEQGKATFIGLLGLDGARDQAHRLADQAVEHLAIFEKKAEPLRHLARYVVERQA